MPTVIIGIADPHISDKKPRSRKDDFIATQERKLRELLKLCSHIRIDGRIQQAQALVIAGDLFTQNKGQLISRKLDNQLIRIRRESPCPWVAIPGNHDMMNDRLDSLETHPMGVMREAGLLEIVVWPEYTVVKGPKLDDPRVIISGRQYTTDGPGRWIDYLAETGELRRLKQDLYLQDSSSKIMALLMTHSFWGSEDGINMGEPVVGHLRVRETGANVLLYGHPHTFDGEVKVQDREGQISIVGPGALIRGTLAEHDIYRQPKVVVMIFYADGTHKNLLVTIPHEAAEKVFDLERHERQKEEKQVQLRFIQELQNLNVIKPTSKDIFSKVEENTPRGVVTRAQQFITQAEAEVGIFN